MPSRARSRRALPFLRGRRNPEGRMSLGDHLRELRRRFVIAVLSIVAGAVVGWLAYDWLLQRLIAPLQEISKERGELVTINLGGLTDAFSVQAMVALFVGVIISSPVWLWQIWGFVVPGLTTKEKRTAAAFILTAAPLFVAGCYAAYLVFPKAVIILLGFTPAGAVNLINASDYLGFVTRFILAFGLAFLLPVFLVALNVAHVLPARLMLKGWRVAVIVIFVFAAVMTPTPDPWTMLALALPMVGLFYGAVGVAFVLDRRRRRHDPAWLSTSDDQASAL
ncbi:MAG TPA: twin-arginine translocase subunit TatC [Dermatophilaceae bacterium]|nr:twin-arginine translocase subunit TatC [Dermatophilaceae bacterium]